MPASFQFFSNKRNAALIFLFLFISIFLIQNFLFVMKDSPAISTDSHLFNALIYYDKLVLKNDSNLRNIGYPPLLYLLTTIYFRLNGISTQGARLLMSLFAVIFLLAMFGIGCQLGGYYSGAAVMALAASSPHILNHSRFYFLDFPQTALTALTFYLLLKSDGYRHRVPSMLMGIAMAFSFLIKWSTAFFLIVPVFWFFIPIIIKPGKYLKQYLVPIAIWLFAIIGTSYYFFTVNPADAGKDLGWLGYYILFILLPSAFCLIIMYLKEKKSEKDEDYLSSSYRKLFNFTLMGIIFCVLALPWYFWTADSISPKYQVCQEIAVIVQNKTAILTDFLRTSFSLFPVFLIFTVIGFLTIIFTSRQNLYRNLLLPVNFIFIILLMMNILNPAFRYLLSVVIFTSAMGGFWVSKTGKFRGILTVLILIVSILSIFSRVIFPEVPPQGLPVKTEIMTVNDFSIYSEPGNLIFIQPQPVKFTNAQNEIKPVIEYLFTDTSNPCKRIMIIEVGPFGLKNFTSEYLKFEIFRLTGLLQNDFEWDWMVLKSFHVAGDSTKYPVFEPEDLENTIIDLIFHDIS